MKCPYCDNPETDVIETRDSEDLTTTRRRRSCGKCVKRFTTYERIESVPLIVLKKDGKKEHFSRDKLKMGILKAAEKTTVGLNEVESIISEVEKELRGGEGVETDSKKIGQMVAVRLKKIDKVAYIRFASVFRRFVDLEDFEKELNKLV
jgi:transcriptional repressor NrdR